MLTRILGVMCFFAAMLPSFGWSQSSSPMDAQIAQARAKGVEFLK